jgi:hypothetical protein
VSRANGFSQRMCRPRSAQRVTISSWVFDGVEAGPVGDQPFVVGERGTAERLGQRRRGGGADVGDRGQPGRRVGVERLGVGLGDAAGADQPEPHRLAHAAPPFANRPADSRTASAMKSRCSSVYSSLKGSTSTRSRYANVPGKRASA